MINLIRRYTLCLIGWHKYGDRLSWFSQDSEDHFRWGDVRQCVACGYENRQEFYE